MASSWTEPDLLTSRLENIFFCHMLLDIYARKAFSVDLFLKYLTFRIRTLAHSITPIANGELYLLDHCSFGVTIQFTLQGNWIQVWTFQRIFLMVEPTVLQIVDWVSFISPPAPDWKPASDMRRRIILIFVGWKVRVSSYLSKKCVEIQ